MTDFLRRLAQMRVGVRHPSMPCIYYQQELSTCAPTRYSPRTEWRSKLLLHRAGQVRAEISGEKLTRLLEFAK
jgi:hypothetical protein